MIQSDDFSEEDERKPHAREIIASESFSDANLPRAGSKRKDVPVKATASNPKRIMPFANEKIKRSAQNKLSSAPSRPLSAYNIFFRDERQKMLAELEQTTENGKTSVNSTRSSASNVLSSGNNGPRARAAVPSLFESMAKRIGKAWKELPTERRKVYKKLAEADKERYRRQLDEYRESIVKSSREVARSIVQNQTKLGHENEEVQTNIEKSAQAARSIFQNQTKLGQENEEAQANIEKSSQRVSSGSLSDTPRPCAEKAASRIRLDTANQQHQAVLSTESAMSANAGVFLEHPGQLPLNISTRRQTLNSQLIQDLFPLSQLPQTHQDILVAPGILSRSATSLGHLPAVGLPDNSQINQPSLLFAGHTFPQSTHVGMLPLIPFWNSALPPLDQIDVLLHNGSVQETLLRQRLLRWQEENERRRQLSLLQLAAPLEYHSPTSHLCVIQQLEHQQLSGRYRLLLELQRQQLVPSRALSSSAPRLPSPSENRGDDAAERKPDTF